LVFVHRRVVVDAPVCATGLQRVVQDSGMWGSAPVDPFHDDRSAAVRPSAGMPAPGAQRILRAPDRSERRHPRGVRVSGATLTGGSSTLSGERCAAGSRTRGPRCLDLSIHVGQQTSLLRSAPRGRWPGGVRSRRRARPMSETTLLLPRLDTRASDGAGPRDDRGGCRRRRGARALRGLGDKRSSPGARPLRPIGPSAVSWPGCTSGAV
jgi:hypothetical protein